MENKKLLKEESDRMRKLMGLKPINENFLEDIIDKIKDSEIVKKIEDFFDADDEEKDTEEKDDSKKTDKEKEEEFFKSLESDPSKVDDMISPLCGSSNPWNDGSSFGKRTIDGKEEDHNAVDLTARQGTTVRSPFKGEVVTSRDGAGTCGGMIEIKLDNGYQVKFCHLSERSVKVGEYVMKGQEVGKSGGSTTDPYSKAGRTFGAHLHLELRKDGAIVDPSKHINTKYCSKKLD